VEGELEIIWESTSKENRRMRELLHKSMRKSNMWSAVTVHEPHLDEISQKTEFMDILQCETFIPC